VSHLSHEKKKLPETFTAHRRHPFSALKKRGMAAKLEENAFSSSGRKRSARKLPHKPNPTAGAQERCL